MASEEAAEATPCWGPVAFQPTSIGSCLEPQGMEGRSLPPNPSGQGGLCIHGTRNSPGAAPKGPRRKPHRGLLTLQAGVPGGPGPEDAPWGGLEVEPSNGWGHVWCAWQLLHSMHASWGWWGRRSEHLPRRGSDHPHGRRCVRSDGRGGHPERGCSSHGGHGSSPKPQGEPEAATLD